MDNLYEVLSRYVLGDIEENRDKYEDSVACMCPTDMTVLSVWSGLVHVVAARRNAAARCLYFAQNRRFRHHFKMWDFIFV